MEDLSIKTFTLSESPEPPMSDKIKDTSNSFILSISKLKYFRGKVKFLKLFQKLFRRSEFYEDQFEYSQHLYETLLNNMNFTVRGGDPILCVHCGSDKLSSITDPYSQGACEVCKCDSCGEDISTRVNSGWYSN